MPLRGSSAAYVAGRLARQALWSKNVEDSKICCTDCRMLAVKPITGPCGHTRCSHCIAREAACLCGMTNKPDIQCNILIRNIIEKMQYRRPLLRCRASSSMYRPDDTKFTVLPASPGKVMKYSMRSCLRKRKTHKGAESYNWTRDIPLRRMASTPDYRMQYVRHLLYWGRYYDAVAHLAQVSASSSQVSVSARKLLVEVIKTLSPSNPKLLIRSMYKSVRFELATAWIDHKTLECSLCYNLLEQPVTTTCGHTFCRVCIKRTLDERKFCPLCSYDLSKFDLILTENTTMVSAMLGAITDNPEVEREQCFPVFICTVSFPGVTCPLMILDAEYSRMVRSTLDVGIRRFGMLAPLEDDAFSNFGTIVEVRDCVELENGNAILSTVGVSRFRIFTKMFINGVPYARVLDYIDLVPTSDHSIESLQTLGQQVKTKAQEWLPSLSEALRMDIRQHFGPFPEMSLEGEWWKYPNGLGWLWSLIAILPLRAEIQMLMLCTNNLSKRMTAVLRTLDAMATFPIVRPHE